jgi:hypothetical protein
MPERLLVKPNMSTWPRTRSAYYLYDNQSSMCMKSILGDVLCAHMVVPQVQFKAGWRTVCRTRSLRDRKHVLDHPLTGCTSFVNLTWARPPLLMKLWVEPVSRSTHNYPTAWCHVHHVHWYPKDWYGLQGNTVVLVPSRKNRLDVSRYQCCR